LFPTNSNFNPNSNPKSVARNRQQREREREPGRIPGVSPRLIGANSQQPQAREREKESAQLECVILGRVPLDIGSAGQSAACAKSGERNELGARSER